MPDHLITISDKQESAAAAIIADINAVSDVKDLTIDKWMKNTVLVPIKAKIAAQDAAKIETIVNVLPDATNSQLNQIKTILGIT